jgi:SAM-dependent methyltransferase
MMARRAVDVFGLAVQTGGAFLRDAAIAAAHDLGLFGALSHGSMTLDELAAAVGVDEGRHRLRALVEVLAASEVLVVERSGAMLRFGTGAEVPARPAVASTGWGRLADVIRSDRPVALEESELRRFHAHLASAGADAARELATLLEGESLLDLGAGAGVYSKAFLDEQPARRATLVDTREVLAIAREWMGPLAARARFVEGDAAAVDLGTGHDIVLLANLLHLHSEDMCARLCAAAARAVAPGGMVVVKDLRIDEDRSGPLEGLLFALNMAVYTTAGSVYPTSQLQAWLSAAGLVDLVERRLGAAPDAIVVIARRPTGITTGGAATGRQR